MVFGFEADQSARERGAERVLEDSGPGGRSLRDGMGSEPGEDDQAHEKRVASRAARNGLPHYRGALPDGAGLSSRSWKSKLKSVSGETGASFTSSMEPSGFSEKVT